MKPNRAVLEPWTGQRLVGVKGTPLQVCGTAQVELKLGEETFQSRVVVVDGLTADVILGLDFLEAHSCTVDIVKKNLAFHQTWNICQTTWVPGNHSSHWSNHQ